MSIYVTDENGELYPLSGGSVLSENKSNISDDAAKYYEDIYEAANKNLISHYYDDCIVTDVRQTIGVSTERQLGAFRSDVLKPILQLIPISEIPSKVHYNVDMFEMIDGNAVEYDMRFFNLEKNTKYTISFSTYINWADTTMFGVTIPVDDTSEHIVEFTTNSRGEYIFEHGFKMLPNDDYAMAVYQFEQICLVKGDYSGLSIQSGDVVTTVDVNAETYETFKRAKKYTDGVSKNKVDVVEGKSLSTNDYTNEDKNKLADINIQSIDFAESERQKSKNLFNGIFTQGAYSFGDGSTVVLDSYIRSKDLIDVKPNENIVLSWVGTTPNDECGFIFYNNGRYVSSTRGTNAVVPSNANQVGFNIGQSPTITVDSVSNCQLEYGTVATDYQPYNGATVHEKQLNEAVEKRDLLYRQRGSVDIVSSSLDTLQKYYDLFENSPETIYYCDIGSLVDSNFRTLVGTPTGFGGYAGCFIKKVVDGFSNGHFGCYELHCVYSFSNKIAKSYIFMNANNSIEFSGWTVIGG